MRLDIVIEGIGVWSPALPGWDRARAVLRGAAEVAADDAPQRPAPALLAANERRRAPDSVLLAFAVAEQACAMAGREPGSLPAVLASAYGDLAISDYLCATLVQSPQELSPTKFHNSVHNAPAGYWAIATGCTASTNAISAGPATFGGGLLEAALLATTEAAPVLFAAYDVPASGALTDVVPVRRPLGIALVLAPPGDRPGAGMRLGLAPAPAGALAREPGVLHPVHGDNPVAYGLPLLGALAREAPLALTLPAGPYLNLELEVATWQS